MGAELIVPGTGGSAPSGTGIVRATGGAFVDPAAPLSATETLAALGNGNPVYRLTSISGTNTIVATATGMPALASGMLFILIPFASNSSTTVTLNIGGAGDAPVKLADNSTLPAVGDIAIGTRQLLYYNGSNFLLLNPATWMGLGAVSNTELGYLDGVTSALQTQLNAKLAKNLSVQILGESGFFDGSATISGDTTLTGNKVYDVLTINTGVTLNPGGYTIRANKIVFTGTAKIAATGGAGSAGSGSTGGGAGTAGGAANIYGAGAAGGAGGAGGTGGSNGAASAVAAGGVGGGGVASSGGNGSGGGSNGGASGSAGTVANQSSSRNPEIGPSWLRGVALCTGGAGGAGGGGGGWDGTNQGRGGGGGGGGGGICVVIANEIDVSGATAGGPIIQANGGAGGAGSPTAVGNTGGGGGGCGGGGGAIRLIAGKITGSLSGALQANGGAGGAGSNGIGIGTGGKGGQGGSAGYISYYNCTTGAWSEINTTTTATAPSAASGNTASSGTSGVTASVSI